MRPPVGHRRTFADQATKRRRRPRLYLGPHDARHCASVPYTRVGRRPRRSTRTLAANLRRRRWLDAVASLPGIASADVIHVQGLEDAESLLTKFSGPLVVTHWGRVRRWRPRDPGPDDGQSLLHRIQRIRESVKLVAIGAAQGEELAAAGMPPADVIPPGIDLQHFTPGDRAEARR